MCKCKLIYPDICDVSRTTGLLYNQLITKNRRKNCICFNCCFIKKDLLNLDINKKLPTAMQCETWSFCNNYIYR